MGFEKCAVIFIVVLLVIGITNVGESRKIDKKKVHVSNILRKRETNAIDFIRLVAMRLIYGVATRIGLGEPISEALNGAFVPPGVDEYSDYGGFDGFDRNDDYDY